MYRWFLAEPDRERGAKGGDGQEEERGEAK
jgi:hypothetical protein